MILFKITEKMEIHFPAQVCWHFCPLMARHVCLFVQNKHFPSKSWVFKYKALTYSKPYNSSRYWRSSSWEDPRLHLQEKHWHQNPASLHSLTQIGSFLPQTHACLCSLLSWLLDHGIGIWGDWFCFLLMFQTFNGRKKIHLYMSFSFLNLSVQFCLLGSGQFSLRAIWTSPSHSLVPSTNSALPSPFIPKSPKSRIWVSSVEDLLFRTEKEHLCWRHHSYCCFDNLRLSDRRNSSSTVSSVVSIGTLLFSAGAE